MYCAKTTKHEMYNKMTKTFKMKMKRESLKINTDCIIKINNSISKIVK